ncbi:cytochrome b5 [Wallemia mellicola]|uniref:Cytochrome b5 n=1 Tax=Wallemia mellicola TaxID=1708541 RepID=A0A4T0TQ66_9BASI|nr:cytochrome b5 [Wallemia mellicola]TIC75078.1 cytochrome b5 [Wallemia mellicola]
MTTIINLVLTIKLIYDIFRLIYPSINYQILTYTPKSSTIFRSYSPKELYEFNGKDESKPIYIAIGGLVFDVTKGKSFYGPDGPYGNFAGRDASRGMALHSFDEDILTPIDEPKDSLSDLTREQRSAMDEWMSVFCLSRLSTLLTAL